MGTRSKLALAAVLIGTVSSTLMQNFLSVSLPTVFQDLDGLSRYGWVAGAYLLASCATIALAGGLADRWGPRVVYTTGTALYAAGTLGLSFAGSADSLIA